MLQAKDTGDFGTNYGIRAAIAASVYIEVKAPNAVYPDWSNSSSSSVTSGSNSIIVGPDEAYLYTFSGIPPLKETGFWSITAYYNGYLIPNKLNRYTLGDRSQSDVS